MATEIILPKFGNTVEECIIKLWHKKVGDSIEAEDVLCEVETDKTTMDVPSLVTGTVLHVFYDEGDVVPVLSPIVIVGEPNEDITAMLDAHATEANTPHIDNEDSAHVASGNLASNTNTAITMPDAAVVHEPDAAVVHESDAAPTLTCSPRATLYLEKLGLSIYSIMRHFSQVGNFKKDYLEEEDIVSFFQSVSITTAAIEKLVKEDKILTITEGTGIGGKIIEQDISPLPVVGEREKDGNVAKGDVIPSFELEGIERRKKVTGIRKIIASRMLHSLQSTAQLTLTMQASAVKLKEARKFYKSQNKSITINDIILHAVSRVLEKNLWANSIYVNDEIISYKHVNLACAVQTDQGLLVPVIRCSETMGIEEISDEMHGLGNDCKDGKIDATKLEGGTFTVSNLGVYKVQSFTPILNAPQTGILGVGGIEIRAVEKEKESDTYCFEPAITLSLTFDHRAYDGADAAMLLQSFVQEIEGYSV